jgi:aminoglycoside/choline kinase family phosphotransferase
MDRYRLATGLFADAGIRVPQILATAPRDGFMLIEDLGPMTVFEKAEHAAPSAMADTFAQALAILPRIQTIPPGKVSSINPDLDGAWLARELEHTWDSFLTPRRLGGVGLEAQELRVALDRLCAALGDGAQGVCHRDFMARNLIPTDQGLAVIDHQDIRLGPVAYDLASLLNDSWFPPDSLEEQLLEAAFAGLLGGATHADYHRAAAQRTLKALGTFARAGANGSAKHEALVAPTMARALRCLARAPETRLVAAPLSVRWRQHLLD